MILSIPWCSVPSWHSLLGVLETQKVHFSSLWQTNFFLIITTPNIKEHWQETLQIYRDFLKFSDDHNTDWNDEFGILITISISTILFSIKVSAADTKKANKKCNNESGNIRVTLQWPPTPPCLLARMTISSLQECFDINHLDHRPEEEEGHWGEEEAE